MSEEEIGSKDFERASRGIDIGAVARGGVVPKEMSQIGLIAKTLQTDQFSKIFEVSKSLRESTFVGMSQDIQIGSVMKDLMAHTKMLEGLNIGKVFRDLSPIVKGLEALPGMDASLGAVGRATALFAQPMKQQFSTLFQTARLVHQGFPSVGLVASTGVLDFFKSSQHKQLLDLIRNNKFDIEQVVEEVERESSLFRAENYPAELDSKSSIADAHNEVFGALLNRGSLKGVSPAGIRYFIFFVLLVVTPALLASVNQLFELQKNISERFVESAKSPAEARSLARRVPPGVIKSEIIGFRILTGDGVFLREGPGKRFDEVLKLQVGSLLQVIDSSDHAWIHVSVVVDGDAYEGWILRGYTKRIQ